MDKTLSLDKKIEAEKLRRNQIYKSLDYLLSVVTYFDFFSYDAFEFIKHAYCLANFYSQSILTSEFLVSSFFFSSNNFLTFLKEFQFNQEELKQIMELSVKKNIRIKLPFFFLKEEKVETTFSPELYFLFEQAAENALVRFKTPIITIEILFITLMEQKELKGSKLIKKLLKNETEWFLLRYQLIKRIHTQESKIRLEVSKNQQYFAYLLKTQLSDFEFETLLKNDILFQGVTLFRNTLISSILKINIFKIISKDVSHSMKLIKIRRYSS